MTRRGLDLPTAAIARLRAGSGYVVPLALCLLLFPASSAASAQELVSGSPDTTIDLGSGIVAADEDVVVDNQLGVLVLESLGSLPGTSSVVGYGLAANGDRLFTMDSTTQLAAAVFARPGDVARYDGVEYSIEFDGAAAGLPFGVVTDAVASTPAGLILSFDTTVDLGGGLVVADEDLVAWDGSTFSLQFDGSVAGLAGELDVDAVHALGGGAFVLSLDTTGEVGGVAFADEDLVRFDGAAWTLEFDASASNSAWGAADLEAVFLPEPALVCGLWVGVLLLAGGGSTARLDGRVSRRSAAEFDRT